MKSQANINYILWFDYKTAQNYVGEYENQQSINLKTICSEHIYVMILLRYILNILKLTYFNCETLLIGATTIIN